MMFALLAALLVQPAALPLHVTGDPAVRIEWRQDFASPGDDWVNDLVALPDGHILAVGFLDRGDGRDWRGFSAFLGADGRLAARHDYGAGGGIDSFWSATAQPNGGIVYAGFTSRLGGSGIDGWAVFADAAGRVTGERAFGGAGYDRFTDLAVAGDETLLIGHSQRPGDDRRRLFAVRLRADGTTRWERIIEGPETIAPLYAEPAPGGGFIIAGGIGDDLLVMKLDEEGREVWRRRIGEAGTNDTNHGLALLPNGRILVVGYSQSWGAQGNDIVAVTLSADGEVLHRAMFGGPGDDRPSLVKADAAGRAWIIGQTTSAGAGRQDALLLRVDARGRFEPGAVLIGTTAEERGTALLPLGDGSVIVAGFSTAPGAGGEDAFVARLSAPTFAEPAAGFSRRDLP
ncbi:MAG TPA: hypothetical protein VEC11_04540 [Allosphingosinicella sp.]|nr:hypothetical protein [Allosphingosinicella sp.]